MKSIDIGWNIKSDSITLFYDWHWLTKVWGANRIRYPSSPHPEYWMLDQMCNLSRHSASIVLWQRRNGIDLAGLDISSGACGLIGWYALNLTFSSLVLHGCCKLVQWWFVNQRHVPFCTPLQARTAQWEGLHTCYKGNSQFGNRYLSSDYELELAHMKLELLVIAVYHPAVNQSLETVQTACQYCQGE